MKFHLKYKFYRKKCKYFSALLSVRFFGIFDILDFFCSFLQKKNAQKSCLLAFWDKIMLFEWKIIQNVNYIWKMCIFQKIFFQKFVRNISYEENKLQWV